MKLFRRKTNTTESGTEPIVPVSEAQPVEVVEGSSAAKDAISVEEYRQDGGLVLRAEMPGIDPDKDVRLTVVDGCLVIEAERREEGHVDRDGFVLRELRYERFSRSLPLATGVTAASITATYKDGLLEVRIPAAADTPATPPTEIPITTS